MRHRGRRETKGEGAQAGLQDSNPTNPGTERRKQHNFRAPIQGKDPVAATECEILTWNPNSTLTVPCAAQLPRQTKLKPQKAMCEEMKNAHRKNCYAQVLYSWFVLQLYHSKFPRTFQQTPWYSTFSEQNLGTPFPAPLIFCDWSFSPSRWGK